MTLCELRQAKGLSQKQLAKLSGVSVSMISHIELGYARLSDYIARRLAGPLGVEPTGIQARAAPPVGGPQRRRLCQLRYHVEVMGKEGTQEDLERLLLLHETMGQLNGVLREIAENGAYPCDVTVEALRV